MGKYWESAGELCVTLLHTTPSNVGSLTHLPGTMPKKIPSYRLHKGTGQGYTSHRGKCYYFGPYGTAKSRQKYSRFIAELTALDVPSPVQLPSGTSTSVAELCAAFWEHVKRRYIKHGESTSEVTGYRTSLAPVIELYGDIESRDFGPIALCTVRALWEKQGLARKTINQYVGRIVRCWKWGVAQQAVSVSVWQSLLSLDPLRPGQGKDNAKVKAVDLKQVDAIKPFVSRQIWALIQFQLWTGCRPHEACQVRMSDIDQSHEIWEFRPGSWKTQHRGEERIIWLGPHAQELIKTWKRKNPSEWLWQPREARTEWMKEHGAEKAAIGKHQAGEQYTANTYGRAVERACEKAFDMPKEYSRYFKAPADLLAELKTKAAAWRREHCWSPNQLRHAAATRIRATYGIELARIIFCFNDAFTTEIYAENELEKARNAIRDLG